jgi:poly-gamma-glutamate capsule biosynthesis protein CapA/YwtB (metallophosphatase superfamily)
MGTAQKTVSIIGVGDIMMGTNYPESSKGAYLPPDGGITLFAEVTPFLHSADIVFGNLEGVIMDKGGTPKSCNNPNVCYVFRTPESYVTNLTNAGFNVMNMANNHVHDFGRDGALNSLRVLTQNKIHTAGLEGVAEYTIFEQNGLTFGFCGFAPNTGTVSINNYAKVREIIPHLDSLCDIVIVSFHGGAEGATHSRVPKKREIFLGENRGDVYEFAHLCIDLGADVVFGHGPHVPRAMELYKDRFIAYSLGNFCTPFRMNMSGTSGYAPMVKVITDQTGQFLRGELQSAVQRDRTGPKLDEQKACIKEIKRLTELDFPTGRLLISNDGILGK